MLDKLKPIEDKLAEVFKGLPQLSDSAKKSLAGAMEWVALVFGILQALSVWWLWDAGQKANTVIDFANSLTRAVGGTDVAPKLGLMFYLSLAALAASAVTLLMAYPGLKAGKKVGWNWLFLGVLVNLVYGVFSIFVDKAYGGGFGDFLMAAVGTAVGFWILFQVREYFGGHHKAAEKSEK